MNNTRTRRSNTIVRASRRGMSCLLCALLSICLTESVELVPPVDADFSNGRRPKEWDSGASSEGERFTLESTTAEPTSDSSWASNPEFYPKTTTFYVLGDLPYSENQAYTLKQQMNELPSDAEFVVHVGDIRSSTGKPKCRRSEYRNVAKLLLRSHAPVFVIRGDNDWTDCPNREEAHEYWNDEFLWFENKWDHNLVVNRENGREENFSFVHKHTLFVGLCIVGGEPEDRADNTEWSYRLSDQADWTIRLIRRYQQQLQNDYDDSSLVGRVVLFGHADPRSEHRHFFRPLVEYIETSLDNSIPILYMNGDTHEWNRSRWFYGQSSFMRITVTGLAQEPPVKMMVHSTGEAAKCRDAFTYDRML
jgi:predicted phosphodiesterase